MHILWWVFVGLIAGWAIGKIIRGPGDGILRDTVIGSAGSLTGGFIMGSVGAMPAGQVSLRGAEDAQHQLPVSLYARE